MAARLRAPEDTVWKEVGLPKRRKKREEWSAGGVVVRRIQGAYHFLLIRDPYRNWGLPKGHIEEDEDPSTAALREIEEETGLEDLALGPFLGTVDWYFRHRGVLIHKYCKFYLVGSKDGEAVPEAAEGITECRWLTVPEALEAVGYQNAREMLRVAAELLESEEASILSS